MRVDSSLIRFATLWTALLAPQIPSGRTNVEAATQDAFQAASEVAEPPKPTDDTNINLAPTLRPIVLTEEGKKWIEKHRDIYEKTLKGEDGGLIDASTFLDSRLKNTLMNLTNKVSGPVTLIELKQAENGYKFAFDISVEGSEKERWYISSEPYYKDQFPQAPKNLGVALWMRNNNGEVDKLTQTFIGFRDLFKNQEEFDHTVILKRVEEAKADRKRELEDAAKVRDFDLPKDRPIGYIALVDGHWSKQDPIIRANVDDINYFPELMSSLGYQVVSVNDAKNYSEVADDSVQKLIENQIKAFQDLGVQDFYISLGSHGCDEGIQFYSSKTGCGCNFLFPKELTDIFNRYPNCRFIINTLACYGGALSGEIRNYRDHSAEEGRIIEILLAKPHGTSQEGRLKRVITEKGVPKPYSMYYQVFLIHNLLEGKRYGEAHLEADKASKQLVPADPEMWKSTPNGGIRTSSIFRQKTTSFLN